MSGAEDGVGDAYAKLFAGLDQLGPTTDETREAVLALIRDRLPAAPAIADLGCGTGIASLFLARALPNARIIAIDLHAGFLARLAAEASAQALAITTLSADMASPPLDPASVDLIWCDSAIYNVGRSAALVAWRPLLRPAGLAAFSDVVWTTDTPPEAARAFWAAEYPAMASAAGVVSDIAAAGYALVATQPSPRADWQAYYAPLRRRLQTLRPGATPPLIQVLDGMAREIALFDQHGDSYESAFFIVRSAD